MCKNSYHSQIISLINNLKKLSTNHQTIKSFCDFINSNKYIHKSTNPDHHICSFFVPYDKQTQKIYLVNHIKAQDWIPPGGHIEHHELPIDTVIREFNEELGVKINKKQINLFNLSIKHLKPNPRHQCKVHYDFWHLVDISEQPFNYLKTEFYDANWFSLPQAINKIQTQVFKDVIKQLQLIIKS